MLLVLLQYYFNIHKYFNILQEFIIAGESCQNYFNLTTLFASGTFAWGLACKFYGICTFVCSFCSLFSTLRLFANFQFLVQFSRAFANNSKHSSSKHATAFNSYYVFLYYYFLCTIHDTTINKVIL